MNPYDSLPRGRGRSLIVLWLVIIAVLFAAWRIVVILAYTGRSGGDLNGPLISIAAIAVVACVLFVGTASISRGRIRRLTELRPGAAVFVAARGPQLIGRLRAAGLTGYRLPYRVGVTVDRDGIALWPRKTEAGPVVVLPRERIVRLTATLGELVTSRGGAPDQQQQRTYSGPALGVVMRRADQEGELLVPIPIFGPDGLAFASKRYAGQVLQSAAVHVPVSPSATIPEG